MNTNKGYKLGPMSEEHKRKISQSQKGIPRPYLRGEKNPMKNPITARKVSIALLGIKRSGETIEKCRRVRLGKRPTVETRLKMSKSAKRNVAEGLHHLWKGGVTKLHKNERDLVEMTIEYRLWRETVLKRDDYTCKECGVRGGKLHVDHIKPFSLFPELRVAIDNGRTLCVFCHRKTPTYGLRVFNIPKAT